MNNYEVRNDKGEWVSRFEAEKIILTSQLSGESFVYGFIGEEIVAIIPSFHTVIKIYE